MVALVALVAGCGGHVTAATASLPADDPLAAPEQSLAVETLPGAIAGDWPLPVVRGAAGWALPWQDAAGVHLRLVGDDGSRRDRFVAAGALVGAAGVGDGTAVVVADGGALAVHFVGADGDAATTFAADGDVVPAAASDGARVLVAVTRGGQYAADGPTPLYATLFVVDRAGARAVELGRVPGPPSLWGDARGFVVGGTLLVDGALATRPAPGRQIRDARLFRKPYAAGTTPARDRISLDGRTWADVDGLVGWAATSGDGARYELERDGGGRVLVEVGQDLTPRATRPLPATRRGDGGQAWVAAASADRVVWASTVENDPVFAILDASDLRPDSGVIRLRHASSRTTVVSAAPAGVLFAWTENRTTVRYAIVR